MKMENNEEYELVPCTCPCHYTEGMMHCFPCCYGGFKKVKKKIPKIKSDGTDSDGSLLDAGKQEG
jgi:hypothetical protein